MLASDDVFAGYVIDRQLGRGGMGSVYLAKHPRLPRMTALKLLNREMFFDKEVRARFEREADLVAQLDHPNIVTVYDRGLDDEQLWISMQYVDGIDAASVIPASLPPERAVQIVKETADALDYAHGMGVLHRDVKPANILLARGGGGRGERVYLSDFGIARLRDDTGHLTQTGAFTATIAYASPEQLTGTALDHRSDQYSLACTLYWLFTGKGPFTGTNPAAVIQGHLQGTPAALSSVRHDLPHAIDSVMARAMAKNPDDRFTSCAEFASAAHRALTGQSSPSTPVYGGAHPGTGPSMPMTSGPRPTTGPTTRVPVPTTGVPCPVTQGLRSNATNPLAGQGYSTAPPNPMATGQPPGFNQPPRTGPTQQQGMNPYGQQSGYQYIPPPGPHRPQYGMAQRPPAGPRSNSRTGLIVALSVGIVVLIVVVLVVIGVVTDSSSGSASTSANTTTSAASNVPITADSDAISREFPGMVPANSKGETGYHSASCWLASKNSPPSADAGEPSFGNWVAQWRCYKGNNNDDPYYRFYVYESASDVQSVLNGLPSKATKSTNANGGKSYTNYKYMDSGAKMVTAFTGDPNRAQFLMYVDAFVADSTGELLTWWRQAPLN